MQRSLDPRVTNSGQVSGGRSDAIAGLYINSAVPVLLPTGTVLCRIGHRTVNGHEVPEADNYRSPWWVSQADFGRILAVGQRDPGWAGRVALAISDKWGGDCRLQVAVLLGEPLYAWAGSGRPISGGKDPIAVHASDPRAYWFPDPAITQYHIPGLSRIPSGRSGALWFSAFQRRHVLPLLFAGRQSDLQSGNAFGERSAFAPGHYGRGSV